MNLTMLILKNGIILILDSYAVGDYHESLTQSYAR